MSLRAAVQLDASKGAQTPNTIELNTLLEGSLKLDLGLCAALHTDTHTHSHKHMHVQHPRITA